MSRPTNWMPLLLAHDTVPGCPDIVDRGAHGYGLTGIRSAEASSALNGERQRTTTCSLAVDAVPRQAEGLSSTVQRRSERNQRTFQALLGYAPGLRKAQQDFLLVLQDAKAYAGTIVRSAAHDAEATLRVNGSFGDPLQAVQASADLLQANRQLMRQEAHLVQLRVRITAVSHARDEEAATAARSIDAVVEHSGIKDTLWGKVTSLVYTIHRMHEAIAELVRSMLDTIIRQVSGSCPVGDVVIRRFVDTAVELITEHQIDDPGDVLISGAPLWIFTQSVKINMKTGVDDTIGARDAYILSSKEATLPPPIAPAPSNRAKANAIAALRCQHEDKPQLVSRSLVASGDLS